jgi:hypothetical protein
MNKKIGLDQITNENKLNNVSTDTYKAFNDFIFSEDLKLTGKLLHKFKHFLEVQHLPGDIVEVGVFKGSGMSSFLKFIQIFCPNSNKKVIGFDIFSREKSDSILDKDSELDKNAMNVVYDRVDDSELTLDAVTKRLLDTNTDKFKLIDGDVEFSMPTFLQENPGFRASLIYIDVDLERPTYHTLINMWDRLLPGGVILFDEYEYHKFSESIGVERFLKERNMEYTLQSTNWIAPTAFIVKKRF